MWWSREKSGERREEQPRVIDLRERLTLLPVSLRATAARKQSAKKHLEDEEAYEHWFEELRDPAGEPTLAERIATARRDPDRLVSGDAASGDEPRPQPPPGPARPASPPAARPARARLGRLGAVGGGLVVLLAALAPLASDSASERSTGSSLGTDGLRWLRLNTDPRAVLVAPSGVRRQLREGVPGRDVRDRAARVGSLVVLPPQQTAAPGSGRSLLRAQFSDGSQVRQVSPRGERQDRVRRTRAGRLLVSNTGIRLTPAAWASLSRGRVDLRLMALLDRVTATHTIDVAAFPRSRAERAAGAPARVMRVTAVDGSLLADGTVVAREVQAMLLEQPPALRPDRMWLVGDPVTSIAVQVLLPEPLDLRVPASPRPEGG